MLTTRNHTSPSPPPLPGLTTTTYSIDKGVPGKEKKEKKNQSLGLLDPRKPQLLFIKFWNYIDNPLHSAVTVTGGAVMVTDVVSVTVTGGWAAVIIGVVT